MKNFILILLTLLCTLQILAQNKRDYNWLFGGFRHPDSLFVKGNIIDFNSKGSINTIKLFDAVAWNNSNISDLDGNLLFYFNGCRIIDSSQNIMNNGDSINYGNSWEKHCGRFSYYPGTQNSLILPDPGYEDGYYLIHKRLEIKTEPYPQSYNPELYFSYIDMQANNGLGKVLKKNKAIFKTYSLLPTYLNACKHSNEKDWWIIDQKRDTNIYFKVLLSSDTIMPIDSQSMGPILTDETGFGQAVFSPNGETYLLYTKTDGALIYDFDRDSGQLSNFRQVMVQDSGRFVGAAISPNSRYAYLSSKHDLYQVDLWADDIQSTLTHIDHIDGFKDPTFLSTFNQAQLAPDCKIYIVSSATNNYLHVINSPDEKGKDCDFKQHSVYLPNRNFNNCIPNFPHFRIDENEICDPTITWIPEDGLQPVIRKLNIYPNPVLDQIHISFPDFNPGILYLYDQQGRLLMKKQYDSSVYSSSINVQNLHGGLYYLEFVQFENQEVKRYATTFMKK